MKTFVQTLTHTTHNATQQILSHIFAALSFSREVIPQRTTGGFFIHRNYALHRAVLKREVKPK
jgi:hypothetical protein